MNTSGEPARVHECAVVEPGARIGVGTAIGPFARIESGAQIGAHCVVAQGALIERGARLGDRVVVQSGARVLAGSRIEDEVLIGPNVVLVNERMSRASGSGEERAGPVIRSGASIGANATVLSGLTIGRSSVVGAGSVVTRDVPPNAIVAGNPARLQSYVAAPALQRETGAIALSEAAATPDVGVKGVSLHALQLVKDVRGNLTVGEVDGGVPFVPRRYFVISDVPNDRVRGEHAHRTLEQFLVCLRGRCSVIVDDGERRAEILLDTPALGLYVPPMVWAVQYKYTQDAMLLVLASAEYDAADYIRDYDEFLNALQR